MKAAESLRLWQRVCEVYRRHLRESPAATECLQALNLTDHLVLEHFQAGYSDGSLPKLLSATGELQENLRVKGLLNSTGEETLSGCLVLPILSAGSVINGLCGVKPRTGSTPEQIIVPKAVQGLVRGALVKDGAGLFVSSRGLDAFALWLAGFRNVVVLPTALAGVPELERLMSENGYREIYLCPSDDPPGNLTAEQVRQALVQHGKASAAIIQWPPGISGAQQYFLAHKPDDFRALLPRSTPEAGDPGDTLSPCITETPDGMDARFEGRHYELRAIQKPGPGRLRATVRALGEHGRFVVEAVDFYSLRSRRGFMSESARVFHQPVDVVEGDVSRMTEELERYVQKHAPDGQSRLRTVDESERAEGIRLGRATDLVGEILRDIGSLGIIGEETNKLLGYLVMTSRKLPDPLALLILSGSGAGKSHLQDTVLALCPEEDLVKLTSLTDQALFYRGEDSLRHKVLALEELAGAKGADYAIRNLISARKLVIETTVKNPLTGKLETQVNTVYGPTAVFQTTTSPQTDAETRSRFILVSVDESPAQTRAILQRQRQVHTLEGLRQRQARERILRRHHAFQRLLRQLPVINPFEPLLSYPDEHLLVRRDQPKYLQLILAVAFLHQMQRPLRHDPDLGDYVEATLDDIAIANEVAHQVFGNSLADLSQPGRDLLTLIEDFMQHKAASAADDKQTFSRRELREAIHWGDTRLRVHLRELVDLEHVAPLSGRHGLTYHYRLLSRPSLGMGRFLAGLKSVEQLRHDASFAGLSGHFAPASHSENREVAAGLNGENPAACEDHPETSQPFSREQVLPPPTGRVDP
jgi:DNA primase